MQVFISYAHTPADTALADYLAKRLRHAGLEPWLDTARLKGGAVLQSDIEQAIEKSGVGLFIVSRSWLLSDWTAFELAQFDKRKTHGVRRVPILRASPDRLNLPPSLVKLKGIIWMDDDRESDARFWEVYCAITDTQPGPVSEWNAKGRTVSPGTAVLAAPRPQQAVRPSLRCDRALQWKTIDDLATSGTSEVSVVPGVVGQDHEHFLERIQTWLRMDPPRSITSIHWPTRPSSRGAFTEALAHALNATPATLSDELLQRLAYANLVLLHPCIRARFVDAALVSYYTVWLPELVAHARPRMNVKCVQPVEWPANAGLLPRLLTWLRLRRARLEEGQSDAETFISHISTSASATLRVIRLRDLCDVTPEDLQEFCDIMNLTPAQREWLLNRIDARNPRSPKDLFRAVDDYFPDARSVN